MNAPTTADFSNTHWLHFLDWLRIGAFALLIVYHVARRSPCQRSSPMLQAVACGTRLRDSPRRKVPRGLTPQPIRQGEKSDAFVRLAVGAQHHPPRSSQQRFRPWSAMAERNLTRDGDLAATPLTSCYAVADGKIVNAEYSNTYGKWVELEFDHPSLGTLYAVYCHLSVAFKQKKDRVNRGDVIGLTGNTGNAASMNGEDQHLHFEVRTVTGVIPSGLSGRIDPALLYGGIAPIGWTFFDGHGAKVSTAGALGFKIPGANVREGIK